MSRLHRGGFLNGWGFLPGPTASSMSSNAPLWKARPDPPLRGSSGTIGAPRVDAPMKVRKRFGLRGRNARDLHARLDAIGSAIAARRGVILEIRWLAMDLEEGYRALVLYQLPSMAPDVDVDVTGAAARDRAPRA